MFVRSLWRLGLAVSLLVSAAFICDSSAKAVPPAKTIIGSEGCPVTVITEPESDSKSLEGTPCDDLILAPPGVESIDAGEGNDVIVGTPEVELIEAGPGDDVIFAAGAKAVYGGDDDDIMFSGKPGTGGADQEVPEETQGLLQQELIAGSSLAADSLSLPGAIVPEESARGDEGDNVKYGGHGGNTFYGEGGNDRLYGGIGDDFLYGGPDDDLLAGGHGADTLEGGRGSDWTRGDGTQDHLHEVASPDPGDVDVVSFASGVTPGFQGNDPGISNFPSDSGERGIHLRMSNSDGANPSADNGKAGDGGGVDTMASETDLSGFEVVVGTPFADRIIGSSKAEVIFGGGGTDVIEGRGGNDTLYGGAGSDHIGGGTGTNSISGDGGIDYCTNAATTDSCNEFLSGPYGVIPRTPSKVAVGFNSEVTGGALDNKYLQLYVKGSSGNDSVSVNYSTLGSYRKVAFTLASGSFDPSTNEQTAGCDYSNIAASPPKVTCTFLNAVGNPNSRYLDSLVMAGLGGDDTLDVNGSNLPRATSVMLLGGEGNDYLYGDDWYEQLVDGPGNDVLYAYADDDGLINGLGADTLYAGDGDDLVLSTVICEAPDYLGGGGGSDDNSSWFQARDQSLGVGADLELGTFGEFDPSTGTGCSSPANTGTLNGIENLEGTRYPDRLMGNAGENNLVGWNGADFLDGRAGDDDLAGYSPSINGAKASSNDADTLYGRSGDDRFRLADEKPENSIDCGLGSDNGKMDAVDFSAISSNCESIQVIELPQE